MEDPVVTFGELHHPVKMLKRCSKNTCFSMKNEADDDPSLSLPSTRVFIPHAHELKGKNQNSRVRAS